uniref:TNase-like domain-containing protein n=1 Tax=Ciona savignyi TaxID=51511 RepID=H2Z0X3_CIOSA
MGERKSSMMNLTSQFLDDNIKVVRALPYALLGSFGLYCCYRYRIFSHFKTIRSIPDNFIANRVSLRGQLIDVTPQCTLQVEHIPIVKLPFYKLRNKDVIQETLPIKILGMDPALDPMLAYSNLQHLKGKSIWFQLWHREHEQDDHMKEEKPIYLHCLVYEPYWLFGNYLNTTMIKKGFARFTPFPHDMPTNQRSQKYETKLKKAEAVAKRNRRGIWYEPSKSEIYFNEMRLKTNVVKKKANWLWERFLTMKEKIWKSKK